MTNNDEALRILRGYGDPACYEEMVQGIVRGYAQDVDAQQDGVMFYHAAAKTYMMAFRTHERLEQMLGRIDGDSPDLTLHGEIDGADMRRIGERFGIPHSQRMRQYAYYGALPEPETGLDIRPLGLGELDFVYENYGHASREYVKGRLEAGVMLGAYADGALAGFIGEHTEGAMGLLHVMPEYRRRGVGFALERAAIRHTMLRGFTPYGQVFEENAASHALQTRLGMTAAEGPVLWLTSEPF